MHSFIVGYVRWADRSNTYWCIRLRKSMHETQTSFARREEEA